MEKKPTVVLNELTFSFEDLAKIDSILGSFPYKSVRPIYDIIDARMTEQGEAKLRELDTKQAPELVAVPENQEVRPKSNL